MDIISLSKIAHQAAKEKGFWESDNISEKILLIISEVGEAVNAHRKGIRADLAQFNADLAAGDVTFEVAFERSVKDSFEDEIADCVIRTCDLIGWYGMKSVFTFSNFPFENAIDEIFCAVKMLFNSGNYTFSQQLSYFVYAMKKVAKTENFDLQKHVELKMQYNETRPYKHNCKY